MREGLSLAFLKNRYNRVWFIIGVVCVLFMGLPYVLLGYDSIFVYHDQLDGELIAYLLQAKHLFKGDIIPEFMGGMPKTALTMPAPLMVLLFLKGDGLIGLILMQLIGSMVGYTGMYLLLKKLTGKGFIAMAVGVIFAYLPFLPVYGLSQYGIPLFIYLIAEFTKRTEDLMPQSADNRKFGGGSAGSTSIARICAAALYAVIFAMSSSLVLVGFGVLISVALWGLVCLIPEKKGVGRYNAAGVFLVWFALFFTYLLENISLIKQALGMGTDFVSNKAEYKLSAENFWTSFINGLIEGGQHSGDFHKYFLFVIILMIVLVCTGFVHIKDKKVFAVVKICFAVNIFYAFVAALWNSSIGIMLRDNLNALGAFQADRLLWIAPGLWYLAFGCALSLAVDALADKKIRSYVSCALFVLTLGFNALVVLLGSNLKPNLQRLLNPDYQAISFADYYAIDVYKDVAEFLEEYSGKSRDEFRVASLGIDPAAALYNGFCTIDGYSNNYSVSYKHSFRKIIYPELNKSEYLTDYFDNWGNRCYLFSAECPGYYTVEKGGFYFADYSIDTDAFKELGGEYVISAAYIANADECGLKILREEPFETDKSYYRLYLYQVE